jgi:aspartate dehydrogenase
MRLGVAGLGGIGGQVAAQVGRGRFPGLILTAGAAADRQEARLRLDQLGLKHVKDVETEDLGQDCDLILEAAPAKAFMQIADMAFAHGCTLIAMSAGAVLEHHAKIIGRGRILAPSGALCGLDVIRAAALDGGVHGVRLTSRKPPAALVEAPYLSGRRVELLTLESPLKVFEGDAVQAARGFPANANVAAAIALAGVSPERIRVEIWADPGVSANTHSIEVDSPAVRLRAEVTSPPTPENPKTSRLAGASVLALLERLTSPLAVGS